MHLMQTWSGSTVLLAPQRLHPRGAGLFTPFPADITHSLQAGGVGFPRPLWSKGPGLACLLKCSVTYRWSTAICQKLAVDRNQGRQNWVLSFLPMEGKVDRTRGNGFKWHHGSHKLDIEKNVLIERAIKHSMRLPRLVVELLSPEVQNHVSVGAWGCGLVVDLSMLG